MFLCQTIQNTDSLACQMAKKPLALSLFWRTFSLLSLLLMAVIGAWLWIFRTLQIVPPSAQAYWELVWVGLVLIATLGASALMARLINQPLRALSFAASRIREGEYESQLDENTMTSEIRQVNMGFNRMARELAKVEEDRAVMLAGISHDLRTPLARLRLEAEMSVHDEEARLNIAQDIDQLNAIIDKFMDYARPGIVKLTPVHLSAVIDREVAAFRHARHIRITSQISTKTFVMADDIELGRVLQNLFENSLRYGRSVESGVAQVTLTYAHSGPWGVMTVRDHGPGVDPQKLEQVMAPFYRGDMARTAATGAGLGLAIVEKAIQRMGGSFELNNATNGGLVAHIRLRQAADG
jgi:two-component system osmolarity sensor histidine kinase EnvZ